MLGPGEPTSALEPNAAIADGAGALCAARQTSMYWFGSQTFVHRCVALSQACPAGSGVQVESSSSRVFASFGQQAAPSLDDVHIATSANARPPTRANPVTTARRRGSGRIAALMVAWCCCMRGADPPSARIVRDSIA
jgi:hypothetical protein